MVFIVSAPCIKLLRCLQREVSKRGRRVGERKRILPFRTRGFGCTGIMLLVSWNAVPGSDVWEWLAVVHRRKRYP